MRRLRMGMIGGGAGAFIGPVHRIAAELDGEIALVAGAFSSDAGRSREAGLAYRIDPDRAYPNYETMIAQERARSDGIDFVTIATPNHLHLAAAKHALESGLAVMSDKPATATLAEARILAAIVEKTERPYGLTYTYSGYPLVREARARCAEGALGHIRKIVVEYPQGWLAGPAEASGSKQAAWRVDPAKAGLGGCIGDIGVHAFHLAEFVSGLRVTRICPDLTAFVLGRTLDDDCNILLRFDNGARGVFMASQIAIGELNGLRLRIYGDAGSLDWRQETPNSLTLYNLDGRTEIIRAGDAALGPAARAASRLPGGHPEGYLEAFANLYRDFADMLRGHAGPLVPGIKDGLRGMNFIETSVAASRDGCGWVDLTN